MRVVLDADVVIGALDGSDPHHTRARALLRAGHQYVSLTEVIVAPAADRRRLRTAREAIAVLGVASARRVDRRRGRSTP